MHGRLKNAWFKDAWFKDAWLQAAFKPGLSWAWLLLPISVVYYLLFLLLRLEYAIGLKRRFHAKVPVVVVGNFIVGGAGKTPVVIALTQALQARGLRVGVVSRGYARLADDAQLVTPASKLADVGDEPLLILKKTGAMVAVARVRGQACELLEKQVDIILSDDGLQHFALAREVEWAVFDARGSGNGLLLPAGPMREPLRKVDAVLSTTVSHDASIIRYSITSAFMNTDAQNTQNNIAINSFVNKRCAAAAGIGNPQKFFDALTKAGVSLHSTLALPDHFNYATNPFSALDAEVIFITEKDGLKCVGMDARLWVVPQEATLPDGLVDALLKKVNWHGQKTA